MIGGAIPLVTPAIYLATLVEGVVGGAVSGDAAALAGQLNAVAESLGGAGQMELGGRATRLAIQIESGELRPRDLPHTTLFKTLITIGDRLSRGDSPEDIFDARDAADDLAALRGGRRSKRADIAPVATVSGALPKIDWERYGSPSHPARKPSEKISSVRAALSYYVHYVGGVASQRMHDDSQAEHDFEVDDFFGISSKRRRDIRIGNFVPKKLGDFPTADARKLIDRSAQYEPLYGELMEKLVTYSILEAFGLPMVDPGKDANWQDTLLFDLGFLVAKKLLTEEGKKEVMKDKPLVRVVRRQANLARDNWHPGETRKEIIDRWFRKITAGDEAAFVAKQKRLGDGIIRDNKWKMPRPDASEALRLQWLVRFWIARGHYGALPGGLRYSPGAMIRFMFYPPPKLEPSFVGAMKNMMRGFYEEEELERLQVANLERR